MTMLERVARALRTQEWGKDLWDDAEELERSYWLSDARAAVEAMREPTGRMADEGSGADYLVSLDDGTDAEGAAVIWKAMIDQILKGERE